MNKDADPIRDHYISELDRLRREENKRRENERFRAQLLAAAGHNPDFSREVSGYAHSTMSVWAPLMYIDSDDA